MADGYGGGPGDALRRDGWGECGFHAGKRTSPANGLILFRNGIVRKRGFDYTLSGNTITFIPAATPQPEDVLLAWHRF